MRRDPTEFRERFLRWKNGELVYDKGLAIKHAAAGIDKTYDVGSHPIFDSLVVTPHGATFPSIQNAVKTKLEYDMIKDLGLFDDDDDRQDYMWYSMLNNNANPFFTNIVPHYRGGKDAGVQRYIDATLDEQNGRYFEQSFLNNPVILFLDPSGISGYNQVKEAFENGNNYDKVVSVVGAIPLIGKLKPFSRAGSVINIPSDVKSYSDWQNYYNDIIYTDTERGRIGTRRDIGSADNTLFNMDMLSGKIRKATPDEIRWWYNYNKGLSRNPSPAMPLGSVIGNIVKNKKPKYSTGKDATVDKIIAAEGKLLRTPLDIGDGKWTVGTGLTGKEYIAAARAKGTWTDEDNYAAVTKEVNKIRKWLPDTIPTYNLLPKDAQDVLIDIAYNVGLGGISKEKSPKFHAALERGDWKEAARLMDWGNNLLTTDGRPMTGLRTRNANRRKAFLEAMLTQRAATVDRKQQTLQLAPTSFVLDARRWPTTGGAGFVIPYSYKPIQQTKQIEPPKYAPNDYLKRALYYMLQQDF